MKEIVSIVQPWMLRRLLEDKSCVISANQVEAYGKEKIIEEFKQQGLIVDIKTIKNELDDVKAIHLYRRNKDSDERIYTNNKNLSNGMQKRKKILKVDITYIVELKKTVPTNINEEFWSYRYE